MQKIKQESRQHVDSKRVAVFQTTLYALSFRLELSRFMRFRSRKTYFMFSKNPLATLVRKITLILLESQVHSASNPMRKPRPRFLVKLAFATVLACMLFGRSALADTAEVTWNAGSTNWGTAANWTLNVVPAPAQVRCLLRLQLTPISPR